MREKVAAQIGFGSLGESHAALACGFELSQQVLEIRPSILWVDHFRSHHAAGARRDFLDDNRIFAANLGLLGWLGRRIEHPMHGLEHKIFHHDNVLDAACYRPAVFSGLKCSLLRR